MNNQEVSEREQLPKKAKRSFLSKIVLSAFLGLFPITTDSINTLTAHAQSRAEAAQNERECGEYVRLIVPSHAELPAIAAYKYPDGNLESFPLYPEEDGYFYLQGNRVYVGITSSVEGSKPGVVILYSSMGAKLSADTFLLIDEVANYIEVDAPAGKKILETKAETDKNGYYQDVWIYEVVEETYRTLASYMLVILFNETAPDHLKVNTDQSVDFSLLSEEQVAALKEAVFAIDIYTVHNDDIYRGVYAPKFSDQCDPTMYREKLNLAAS